MPDANESKVLVSRWRAGDQDAAKELFDRYASRLVALARKQISQRLASRVDPEDVVQSVFRSFFGRVKAGKFHIEEQDDLGKLLVRITVHKTLRKVEFHQAAKRDPRMEAKSPWTASMRGSRTESRSRRRLRRPAGSFSESASSRGAPDPGNAF